MHYFDAVNRKVENVEMFVECQLENIKFSNTKINRLTLKLVAFLFTCNSHFKKLAVT
jgi:hypothetical protein